MKLQFLNRSQELKRINAAITTIDPCLVILYGRRRCGKSRLLNQIRQDGLIYHLADLSEPALQRINLATDINRQLPGFSDVIFPSWESLFTTFFIRLSATADSERCTLVLDEFPYIAQLDPSVPSVLQKLYDTNRFGSHLILCGSSQRMMYGIVLEKTAPLYGRASEILKIRPLTARWIVPAFKIYGKQAIEAYAVWGGVPRYWEEALRYDTMREAVTELVFNRDGVFHQEPHRLLLDDMRSDVQPHSLLSVIANGAHRLSEIAGRLGKQAVSLTNPLMMLIDLGYIKRDLPFGESLKSTRRTLYRLNDPFLLFWYRYVYPYLSLCEQNALTPVLQHWDINFNNHLGEIWEELARLSVPFLKLYGIQWKEAYRWWGTGRDGRPLEIDIVSESMDGKHILLGEAKWRDDNDARIVNRLHRIVDVVPFVNGKTIHFAYWVPEAKEKGDGNCHVVRAEEVIDVLV